jgi:ribulose-5-phosphate 4-epimerase/fuculose-1-phosphate aldolase
MKMHLAVYRKSPDVKSVIHASPPKVTAFAVAGIKFDRNTLPKVVFSLDIFHLQKLAKKVKDKKYP